MTSPAELEAAFARANQLRADIVRRQRSVGRRISVLAQGLANLMEPGDHLYRVGVGVHAFAVGGKVCLAAAYLEDEEDGYRYRYAVLCGGEAARVALRTATLDPGDSDEPGPTRRVALASYHDFEDFLSRLPKYLGDLTRRLDERLGSVVAADAAIAEGRRLIRRAGRPRTRLMSRTTPPG